MRFSIIFFFLLFFAQLQAQTYQDHFKAAAKAYEAKNYELMLKEARKAHALRPQHQTLMYYLSMAYALNYEVDSANFWLRNLITIDAENYDIDRVDFNGIKESEGYKNMKSYQEFMNAPMICSDTALVIPDSQLHIEDVAFDAVNKRLLFSSINKKNVFSVENGELKKIFNTNFQLGITGMEVRNNILWFTAAGFAEAGIPTGDPRLESSMLYKADLERGVLLDSFSVSDDVPHTFGDLLITENNDVLVSDSKANKIYVLKDGKLVEWFDGDQIISLQGIAQIGEVFFLADYSQGLFLYNPKNRRLTAVSPPTDLSLKGIDGLYAYQEDLIAIQNGVTPHRITYLKWDEDLHQVISFKYLEKNHPAMGEPTLGFIANQQLYYVANSFWGLNNGGEINNPANHTPIILRLHLDDLNPGSEQIKTLDYVKILNGKEAEAHFYYENNWAKFRKYAKKHGQIVDFFLSKISDNDEYNLILETIFENKTQLQNIEEVFENWNKSDGAAVFLNEIKPAQFRRNVKGEQVQVLMSGESEAIVSGNCDNENFRAFDFWLGDWQVYSRDGNYIGYNNIKLIQNGCGLQENWQSAKGLYSGTSYTFYNVNTGKWNQSWIDNQGGSLQLVGAYQGGIMELHTKVEGSEQSRITWQLQANNSVTQKWEKSKDGGKSWEEVFYGIYKRQ